MNYIISAALCIMLASSCTPKQETKQQSNQDKSPTTITVDSPSKQFMDRIAKHKGMSYEGVITAGSREGDGFTGEKLIMHVERVEDNRICIPFHVGNNRSRVWILTSENDRILLKHDHRHQDGAPDKVTMYGGWTTNVGTEDIQVFPADQETRELIDYAAQNVWSMTIDDSTFSYNLQRIGSDRYFRVEFDLTRPVETPPAAWGWEKK